MSKGRREFISEEEITFQSGLHIVSDTDVGSLEIIGRSGLFLIGETSNVTIKCLQEFYFDFKHTSIKISNITFNGCQKYLERGKVRHRFWSTLKFNSLTGNIIMDNVQLKNVSNTTIWITLSSRIIQADNVSIVDSLFDNSCITCTFESVKKWRVSTIVIRNTTFHSCSCESVIELGNANIVYLIQIALPTSYLILHNVNISDNKSPYVIKARLANITITGYSNTFHRNLGAV